MSNSQHRRIIPAITILAVLVVLLSSCSGPASVVRQWEYTGGPYAQNISAFLSAEERPSLLFAGLDNGDVFASQDGGVQWTKVSTIRPGARIYQMTEHPEIRGRIYAATSAGLFVSSNEAKDWVPLPLGGTGSSVLPCRLVAIDPWKTTVLYAGTMGRGLFKSTDGGGTWAPIVSAQDAVFSFGDVYDIAIDILKPDVVYAAIAQLGVMRSSDAGLSWTRLTEETSATSSKITHILLSKTTSGQVLYGTDAGSFFKSTDGGTSWSPARRGPDNDRILTLAVHPANPDYLLAGTEMGILLSPDFGSSWQTLSSSLPSMPVSVVLSPSRELPIIYAYGEGIGIQASADSGRNWHAIDDNVGGSTVWMITSDRNGRAIYAIAGRSVVRYDHATSRWENAGAGIRGQRIHTFIMDADTASTLYASTPVGVFKTTNNGETWQPTFRKLSIVPSFLETHPAIRTRMYASGEKGLFVSTDRGNSWVQAKPYRSRLSIRSFTFTPTNAGIIHSATAEGVVSTTDGGFTWQPARFGMSSENVIAVSIDADDPKTYFAWTAKGDCFRSTNRGLEWNQYTPPWKPGEQVEIAPDRWRPSSVVAIVSGQRVYYSSTGGATWQEVLDSGTPLSILTAHWNDQSKVLYVGTKDRGIYRFSLGSILKEKFGE